MSWNEDKRIFEISLKQKEESRWVQLLILMAKEDFNSAKYNSEIMYDLRKQETKNKEYNQSYSLKEIYNLVSEGLLLAKCKILSKIISRG